MKRIPLVLISYVATTYGLMAAALLIQACIGGLSHEPWWLLVLVYLFSPLLLPLAVILPLALGLVEVLFLGGTLKKSEEYYGLVYMLIGMPVFCLFWALIHWLFKRKVEPSHSPKPLPPSAPAAG